MKVSVVVPLYNKAAYIGRALRTALAQTHAPMEILVVDDGSTDDSLAAVAAVADPRIRVISQPNAGPGPARDRGIRAARGEAVALLDADDAWAPGCLAALVALLRDYPDAGVAGVGCAVVGPDGRATPLRLSGPARGTFRGVLPDYYACALADPPLGSSSTIIRRDAYDVVDPAPSPARLGEDLYLWSQLADRYPIAYDSSLLALYHTDAAGRALNTARDTGEMPVVTRLRHSAAYGTPAVRAYVTKYQLETLTRMVHGGAPLEQMAPLFAVCERAGTNRTAWWWVWDALLPRRLHALRAAPWTLPRLLAYLAYGALRLTRPLWRPVQKWYLRWGRE